MARSLGICLMVAALLTLTSLVRAEEPSPAAPAAPFTYDPTFLAAGPRMCRPGAQARCACQDGRPGTQTCDSRGIFSLCACASVTIDLPQAPSVSVVPVDVDVERLRRPKQKKKKKRSSGVGLLIGGAVTLGMGTASLAWGIDRVRDKGKDPLGIVLISTGGTAMLVGLPLTIVGIVFVATRSSSPDKPTSAARKDENKVRFMPTADGFALSF
ncbi:hypothetical protein [Polyangium fumosum]|uniref:Uncharacterized protein n=1 Tax=Polyangium fumosum TaxID=889272 RepID=A0A4U1J5H4_9BACT|nr:hypothetical protein [Polyangium fumosum]TKD02480.1 hypothetical protein E8A74_28735 [Polyangium fumosum]